MGPHISRQRRAAIRHRHDARLNERLAVSVRSGQRLMRMLAAIARGVHREAQGAAVGSARVRGSRQDTGARASRRCVTGRARRTNSSRNSSRSSARRHGSTMTIPRAWADRRQRSVVYRSNERRVKLTSRRCKQHHDAWMTSFSASGSATHIIGSGLRRRHRIASAHIVRSARSRPHDLCLA